jgi:small-conductance mechanosensitive channel
MDPTFWGLSLEQWTEIGVSVLILLLVLFLGRWVISFLLDRVLIRLTRRTKTNLDNEILNAARLPLWLLALFLALDSVLRRIEFLTADFDTYLDQGFYLAYFLVGFIFTWRLVTHLFRWYGEEIARQTETNIDQRLFPFFQRIALIILSAIGLITILSHFDVNITAMVTTLGIGSLAVALAAQNTLEDTINGFMIMFDRPYRIGDRIELLDLDTWGDVVDIGLRSTRIKTRDNRMVVVPNSKIGKSLVVNYAYPNDQYRLQIHLGVAVGTDIEFARQVMVEAVKDVEGVLPDRPVEALFLEFGEFSLIFRVRWWLDSYVDTRRMFDRVNSALYKALQKEGIELPFPQLDVHYRSRPDQKQV